MIVHFSQADRNLPFESELECIGEKIEHDLLPHVPVHIHGLAYRQAINHKA